MTYDFEKFKKDKVSLPRNEAWDNWAKFEKVGDKVQGYIRDVFYRGAEGQFKEQRGITLEQTNGKLVNIAIKRNPSFILKDTDAFRIGDPLTVELSELKKSETKGFNPTKIFTFYGVKLPENTGKTVKELEAEDMAAGGTATPDSVAQNGTGTEADEVPFL